MIKRTNMPRTAILSSNDGSNGEEQLIEVEDFSSNDDEEGQIIEMQEYSSADDGSIPQEEEEDATLDTPPKAPVGRKHSSLKGTPHPAKKPSSLKGTPHHAKKPSINRKTMQMEPVKTKGFVWNRGDSFMTVALLELP